MIFFYEAPFNCLGNMNNTTLAEEKSNAMSLKTMELLYFEFLFFYFIHSCLSVPTQHRLQGCKAAKQPQIIRAPPPCLTVVQRCLVFFWTCIQTSSKCVVIAFNIKALSVVLFIHLFFIFEHCPWPRCEFERTSTPGKMNNHLELSSSLFADGYKTIFSHWFTATIVSLRPSLSCHAVWVDLILLECERRTVWPSTRGHLWT